MHHIRSFLIKFWTLILLTIFAYCNSTLANAANSAVPDSAFKGVTPVAASTIVPPPPTLDANGYMLMDAATGQIIASKNMDVRMPPASLTKLMTLYIVASALANNRIHFNDPVTISENAWKTGGSRMFIQVGTTVPVSDLIQGIVVVSGNDATVAMAEFLAGDESSFVPIMNQTAKNLGMTNTHYTDSNGLPHPEHFTSPHDVATLARAIVTHFPQYYSWYGQKWFTWNNIRQPNRNRLLWRDPTVDGMKTGHTEDAGYCLVASAKRNNMRLISVIMGAKSDNARADGNQALLDYGFRFYRNLTVAKANAPISKARVFLGDEKDVPVGVSSNVVVTLPINQLKNIMINVTVPTKLNAPVKAGQVIGTVTITLDSNVLVTYPAIALKDDPKAGIFSRMADYIALGFKKLFHKQ
jgi:D-alanyl-D-alanine carboxypeptidase (penicillin-binding protein 5/6)